MLEHAAAPAIDGVGFLGDLLAEVLTHPALHHSFLTRFAETKLTRAQLIAFSQQQYCYSKLFARNLAAVIANTPDENARTMLTQNMYEEVGEPTRIRDRLHLLLLESGIVTSAQMGEALEEACRTRGGDPTKVLLDRGLVARADLARILDLNTREAQEFTHPALFRRFLRALGLSKEDLMKIVPLPATRDFIAEYEDVTHRDHWLSGLGALGPGTECVVSSFYTYLLRGIVRTELVTEEDYLFWTIHVHCDDGHGRNIVEALTPYASSVENQERVGRGARRVLDARKRWFDALESYVFAA